MSKSLSISMWIGTISNALLMSKAMSIVLRDGGFWLKPDSMFWVSSVRRVVVKC